ncbi:MAG: hypothetical protein HC786_20425 [Richelia sp. CSU_2_1]|nr:hypothetical protein [Richelia sp. CSU_2_1]
MNSKAKNFAGLGIAAVVAVAAPIAIEKSNFPTDHLPGVGAGVAAASAIALVVARPER